MKEINVAIVIPSYKRANRVYAKKAITLAILCVPESQAEEYKKYNPEMEIVAHPDGVKGIAAKRQWIYDKWGNVFMLDDDIVGFYRLYHSAGEEALRLSRGTAYEVVQMVANVAHELGAYLFGFGTRDPRPFKPNNPFRLTGFVSGYAFGLLEGSKLSYDEPLLASELEDDFYISLLNAYHHRICFKDMRFGISIAGLQAGGGLAKFRNSEVLKKNYMNMRKLFGTAIVRKRSSGRLLIRSKWEGRINLPF